MIKKKRPKHVVSNPGRVKPKTMKLVLRCFSTNYI